MADKNKNLPNQEYPASASEPSGLRGLFKRRNNQVDLASISGVYAGPAQMQNRPPMPMQTVYAGPDFFNRPNPNVSGGFAAGPDPVSPAPAPTKYEGELVTCSMCGNSVPAGIKFCPECGHPFTKLEKC